MSDIMKDTVFEPAAVDVEAGIGTFARVIADSVSPTGQRLVTVEVNMHRFVLAELNTHRVFSRNSASSRAIPLSVTLRKVIDAPAWPLVWPSEKPGMQGGTALEGQDLDDAHQLWVDAHAAITQLVSDYIEAHPDASRRLHKSVVNRLLEPFFWHRVIITATDWSNFFELRCSPLAQPEIQAVAYAIRDAMEASEPTEVDYGGWHQPYVRDEDREELARMGLPPEAANQVAVARCTRVSYLTHDRRRDLSKDLELYEKLIEAHPPHASPLEHVARPVRSDQQPPGNLRGWAQLRHIILGTAPR
jgi:thymidylate synthase ThyX